MATITKLGFDIAAVWDGAGVVAARSEIAALAAEVKALGKEVETIQVVVNDGGALAQIQALRAAAGAEEKPIVMRVVADTAQAKSSLTEVELAVQALTDSQIRLAEVQGSTGASAAELAAAQNNVAVASERVSAALDAEAVSVERDVAAMRELTTATVSQSDAVVAQAAANDKSIASMNMSAGAAAGFGAALDKVGKVSAVGFGVSVGVAVKAASDMQTAMVHLSTSAGLPKENIDDLSNAFLNLSSETGTSATDLANASYKVLSLGYNWQDTANIMHSAAELSKIDNSDLTVTTQAVVQTMHDYHLAVDSNVSVSNALRAAVERSNTTLGDFTEGIGRAEQSASALHINFTQVYGALATLTQQGLPASTAIQLLTTTMDHLAASTPKSTKELEGLGLNAVQFHKTIAGPNGLTDGISMLNDAIANKLGPDGLVYLQKELKKTGDNTDQFLKDIGQAPADIQTTVGALGDAVGGVRNLSVILGLSGDNLKGFEDNVNHVTEASKNSTGAIEGWAGIQGTFSQRMDEAKESVKNAAIAVGNDFLPAFSTMADAVKSSAVWLNDHKVVLDTIVGVLGVLGALWIANKVNMIAYGVAMGIARVAMVAWTFATEGAAAGMALLDAAMDANPIGAIVLAVEALIAVIVLVATKTTWFQTIWQYTWNFIKQVATDVWQWLQTAAKAAWDAISAVVTGIWDGIKAAWSVLWDTIKSVWNAFYQPFKAVWEAVWFGIKFALAVVITGIIFSWQEMWGIFKSVWDAFYVPFQAVWSTVWNAVKSAASAVWDWLSDKWSKFTDGIRLAWTVFSTAFTTAWNSVWDNVKTKAEAVWNWLRDQWDKLTEAIKAIWTTVSTVISGLWNAFWDGLKAKVDPIWQWMHDKWDDFVNGVKSIWDTVSGFLTDKWNTVWNGVKDTASTIWNWLTDQWGKVRDGIVGTVQDLVDKVKGVWDKITDIFQGPVDKVKGIWNSVAGKFGLPQFEIGGEVQGHYLGGAISGPGTGTSDSVLARLSNGEHVWTAAEVDAVGGQSAMYALRRHIMSGRGNPLDDNAYHRFSDGGAVDRIDAATAMAKSKGDGREYVYGGSGPDGFDCSGYMSAIYNVLQGSGNIWARSFTTEDDFTGSLGFKAGLQAGFSIGVHNGGGGMLSHMAGTLNGVNVESGGPTNSTNFGGPAAGADSGQFEHQYYLPIVNGQFVSGGPGGGSAGPTPEQIKAHDEAVKQINDVITATMNTTASFAQITEANRFAANQQTPGFVGPVTGTEILSPTASQYLKNMYGIYAPAGDVHGLGTKGVGEGAIKQLNDKLAQMHSVGGVIPGGDQLRIIDDALKAAMTPPPNTRAAWEAGMNTLITRESNWNPNAINNWDSNAANGTPSKGLAQVIQPTFDSFHAAGTSTDIYDPVANVAAAINYIKSRYGDIANVQQANANMPPQGYAVGTTSAVAGWHMVGENGPEIVKFQGGEQVYSFEQIISTLKDAATGTTNELGSKLSQDIQQALTHLVEQMKSDAEQSGNKMILSLEDCLDRLLAAAGVNIQIPVHVNGSGDAQQVVAEIQAQLVPKLEQMLRQRVGMNA